MTTSGMMPRVNSISGIDSPSMARMNRELISSIQLRSTTNCSVPESPWSNSMSSRTPTTAAATVVRRLTSLMPLSDSSGSTSVTSAPASGRNVTRIKPQSVRKSFIGRGAPYSARDRSWPSADHHHEHTGQHGDRCEEQRGVLLDAAGLQDSEDTTGGGRGHPGGVHRAVDDGLVHVVVDPAPGRGSTAADAVHDAVDDVLVGPVRRPGEGA